MTKNLIRCPRYRQAQQCAGTLQSLGGQVTLLGTIEGIDGNTFTELYRCTTCNTRVLRRYRWEAIDSDTDS